VASPMVPSPSTINNSRIQREERESKHPLLWTRTKQAVGVQLRQRVEPRPPQLWLRTHLAN
jgi:hypothetical protein